MSDADAQIRALIARWSQAVLRKDARAIVSLFTEDVTIYDAAPPLCAHGANLDATRLWLDSWGDPLRYDLDDLRVVAGNDVAIAFAIARIGPLKASGEDIRMRLT